LAGERKESQAWDGRGQETPSSPWAWTSAKDEAMKE
jgi:hypothetical protein